MLIEPHYYINVAKLTMKKPSREHYCNIELGNVSEKVAIERYDELKRVFGIHYELQLFHVECYGRPYTYKLPVLFKECMMIGARFVSSGYEEDKLTDDWHGTTECATFAHVVYRNWKETNMSFEDAFDAAINLMKDNAIVISDHGYDDYCRGFLAGEILGSPDVDNVIAKVIKAEQIWENDEGCGYYQDVLNKVKGE